MLDPQNLILLVFVAGLFFLMWSKNRKAKAAADELRNNLAVGSEVMLTSGIYGTVVAVAEDRVTISSGNSSLEVAKGAVMRILPKTEAPVVAKKPGAKKPAAKTAK